MSRYKIIDGSQSAHCCFDFTVVDIDSPVMIGNKQFDNKFESVCECFDYESAKLICEALNKVTMK